MGAENKPMISQYLTKYKDQISAALPSHLTADRMSRIVMTEVRKTPKLLECNPKSLFGAVIQASQIGLEPGGALGHCYLIPYGKEVQLIIGYRGMIDLARRSGQIISIEARAVFEGDEFSYCFGLEPNLEHKPGMNKGEPTHYYAVAKLVGGGLQWDVMTADEVNEVRDHSQGYKMAKKFNKSSPWTTHPVEMGKKTVVRRLFKFLPVSIEIQRAIGLDEQADSGVHQCNGAVIDGDFTTFDDVEDHKSETKTESIKRRLKENETVDTETGEIYQEEAPGFSDSDIILMIKSADDLEALDAACDLIRDMSPDGAKKANAEADKKRKQIS